MGKTSMFMLFCLVFVLGFSSKVFAFREIPDINGNHSSVDIQLALYPDTLFVVRNPPETITDSGRFNQTYDTVNFYSLYGPQYDLASLLTQGYKTMTVEITMDVREVNDGYQYIFIYDDTSTTTRLRGAQFEHTPGEKNTAWKTYVFYLEVAVANLNNNDFVIRYGASGQFEDDWQNENIQVQIGWSFEDVIANYIWKIESVPGGYIYTRLPMAT
jgi:hypothetical protein